MTRFLILPLLAVAVSFVVRPQPRAAAPAPIRFENVAERAGVRFVLESMRSFIAAVRVFFRSRGDTALEVLALRQQVAVLKRKGPRPTLNSLD